MILQCNYEELMALRQGARALLEVEEHGAVCAVAAPAEDRAQVEALVPRLESDLMVTTLSDQIEIEAAVQVIVECLAAEMEASVVATHPADEAAVAAYFDYAHALSVLGRLRDMGSEMRALIEVVTGTAVDEASAGAFRFPD